MFSLSELTNEVKEKFNEELIDLVFSHKMLKLYNSNNKNKLVNDNIALSDGGCAFILCKNDKNKINLKFVFKMKNKFLFETILTNEEIINCLDPDRNIEQFNDGMDLLNINIFNREEEMTKEDNLAKLVSDFLCYQCNDDDTLFYINKMVFNYLKQNQNNNLELNDADKVM